MKENSGEDFITMDGIVTKILPFTNFQVKLNANGQTILCHICGKIRQYRIRIILGDKVTVQISKYDLTKGRIVKRIK